MNRDTPTITVKRSHGTVGQPENDKWIATLHLGGGGWGYYGNSAKEAEAGLRANEHRCEGVKAKVTDKPLYKLSSETVGTGRNKVTRWVTTPITFEDGTPLVTDDQGLIVTDPITEPSRPLYGDDNCCSDCFSPSQDVDSDNGPVAMPEGCKEEDCVCHDEAGAMAVNAMLAHEKSYIPAALHRKLLLMIMLTALVSFVAGVTFGVRMVEVNARNVAEAVR